MSAVEQLAEQLRPHVDEELAKITSVPVSSVFASTTNPRKNFAPGALAELIESVRQHGVMQPILVRPMPGSDYMRITGPAYEIVAGERRWRAARAAGLETIDVKVRDLSDREVLELQIVENLQRQDLHPLEEADGYCRMITSYGYTADVLAEKIGKSRAYIYGRLKLRDLGQEGRNAFYDGHLTASVALIVARVPTSKLQSALLLELLDQEDANGEPATTREVQEVVRHRYMLDLAKAPFPTDSVTLLPLVGSCYACQKRTGNQPELFDDVSDADVCTDTSCFASKKAAHTEQMAAAARSSGLKVITGDEAKRASLYSRLVEGEGIYVDVDAKYTAGETGKTFRELLGDALEPTLIEDTRSGVLVETMLGSALKDALVDAGVIERFQPGNKLKTDKEVDRERGKVAARVTAENAFRQELWKRIAARIPSYVQSTWSHPAQCSIERIVVARAWECANTDCRMRLSHSYPGKTVPERLASFRARIFECGRVELATLAMEIAVSADMHVDQHCLGAPLGALKDAAAALGIIEAHVRRALDEERSGKPKSPKAVSKAKTETPALFDEPERAGSETQPPIEEAPEPEEGGGESGWPWGEPRRFALGDRVRVIDQESKFCGRSGVVDRDSVGTGPVRVCIDPGSVGGMSAYGFFGHADLEAIPDLVEAEQPAVAEHPKIGRGPVKYRDPATNQTWSGRGRKPAWLVAYEASGKPMEALEVSKQTITHTTEEQP